MYSVLPNDSESYLFHPPSTHVFLLMEMSHFQLEMSKIMAPFDTLKLLISFLPNKMITLPKEFVDLFDQTDLLSTKSLNNNILSTFRII